jgi:hypothetical protein
MLEALATYSARDVWGRPDPLPGRISFSNPKKLQPDDSIRKTENRKRGNLG